jgi:hypothetical protein
LLSSIAMSILFNAPENMDMRPLHTVENIKSIDPLLYS